AEAQRHELGESIELATLIVSFVRGEDHWFARRPQVVGDLLIGRGQPGRGVDGPDDDVSLAHSFFGLEAHVGEQVTFARVQADATGVDDGEFAIAPLGRAVQTVAGCPGLFVDYGAVLSDQAVEQCRLADVWPADERHNGHKADSGLSRLAGR